MASESCVGTWGARLPVNGLIFSLASLPFIKVPEADVNLATLGATSHSLPCAPVEPHFICTSFILSPLRARCNRGT